MKKILSLLFIAFSIAIADAQEKKKEIQTKINYERARQHQNGILIDIE